MFAAINQMTLTVELAPTLSASITFASSLKHKSYTKITQYLSNLKGQ